MEDKKLEEKMANLYLDGLRPDGSGLELRFET
jgi:hypothetical protein